MLDISIIIPVLDEQETINKTIEQLYQQTFKGCFEIIVVDGSDKQTTIQCIKDETVVCLSAGPGRGLQMNAGARKARGKILLFLHCDTRLSKEALSLIQHAMSDKSIKAGAFDLLINGKGLFYRMVEKSASIRSRLTRIPFGDQAIFIQKSYFFSIGGYRKIPIMEDVDLMRRIKQDKGRLAVLTARAVTSPRRWEREGRLYCTLRNWTILTLFFFGVKPEKLLRFYKPDTNDG